MASKLKSKTRKLVQTITITYEDRIITVWDQLQAQAASVRQANLAEQEMLEARYGQNGRIGAATTRLQRAFRFSTVFWSPNISTRRDIKRWEDWSSPTIDSMKRTSFKSTGELTGRRLIWTATGRANWCWWRWLSSRSGGHYDGQASRTTRRRWLDGLRTPWTLNFSDYLVVCLSNYLWTSWN